MQGRFQPTRGATVASLLMFMVLIGLGAWQLQRLEWKTRLLAGIEAQMSRPPVPMPENMPDPKAWEYRRVTLAGTFLYNHEFLIKPRTLDGENGYHMYVPFRRASGGVVMVNRGWISDALMPKASRPQGLQQIEGIVQLPRHGTFTPPNAPAKNDWYWPELPAMAQAAKFDDLAPVIVTIAKRAPGVFPAGGKVGVNIRNDHEQYAIFWFTMALILQVIFIASSWKRKGA